MATVPAARVFALPKPQRSDVALATLVAVLALVDAAVEQPDQRTGITVAGALATTLPIAWRSTAPGLAALAATLALGLVTALGAEEQAIVTSFAPLLTLFALGEHGTTRALRWAGSACVAVWALSGALLDDVGGVVFGLCASAGAIAVGRAVRTMSFESEVLERRVDALQQEQEQRAHEAVAAERERISRELHDVVGHSISVMGIQAGAVRRVLPPSSSASEKCSNRSRAPAATRSRRCDG
jgi:signal transduction histidine kinase